MTTLPVSVVSSRIFDRQGTKLESHHHQRIDEPAHQLRYDAATEEEMKNVVRLV